MPIHIDFNHASHLAVAVIRGSLSADDVRNAMHQFMAADARSYRKIIDVASPDTPLQGTDIEQIARMIMNRPSTGSRGPLAFVVGPGQAAENAEMYARLTAGGRPIKVFDSRDEACKWLDENGQTVGSG